MRLVRTATVLLMLTGCSAETNHGVPKAGIHIGQQAALRSGGKYSAVLDSKESFGKWIQSEIAGDQQGKVNLAQAGNALLVPSESMALVIDVSYLSQYGQVIPLALVRITSGEFAGKSGWVATSQLVP